MNTPYGFGLIMYNIDVCPMAQHFDVVRVMQSDEYVTGILPADMVVLAPQAHEAYSSIDFCASFVY